MRKAIILLIFLGLIATFSIGFGGIALYSWAARPVAMTQPVEVDFPKGTPLRGLANTLADAGVVGNRHLFWLWVRLNGSYNRFQAGRYQFDGELTPIQVTEKLVSGDVFRPIVAKVTIPEGFTRKQIIERLAAQGFGHIKEFESLTTSPEFCASLNVPGKTLEGFLYPATYQFTETPSPTKILQQMVQTFWTNLPQGYEESLKNLGLSLFDAVTFASLIELETKFDDERSMVSEVIWNRMKAGTPLGIDAALIYGIPDYDGDIKWKHLKDAGNPYNLRIHKGLPPTPIGNPSAPSLKAVATPTKHGNFYYVLKPGTERHHFSKTLAEHTKYVRQLINAGKPEAEQNRATNP